MTVAKAEENLKKNQKLISIMYVENGTDKNGFTLYKIGIEEETKLIHENYKYDYLILELQPLHAEYVE